MWFRVGLCSFKVSSARGFMRIFSETKPEKEFADSPATKVVKRVQADLEELRVTVRGNEQGWLRVGSESWPRHSRKSGNRTLCQRHQKSPMMSHVFWVATSYLVTFLLGKNSFRQFGGRGVGGGGCVRKAPENASGVQNLHSEHEIILTGENARLLRGGGNSDRRLHLGPLLAL